MKKVIALVSLLAVAVAAIGLLSGCEDSLDFTVSTTTTTTSTASTSTTTTSSTSTTLAAGAKAGDAAQEAVNAVIGVSQTSQSTGNLAGVQPSGFSVSSINAFTNGDQPPDTFFNPLPADGWISMEGAGFVTGETVQIRMYTAGGNLIDGSFILDKKIASIEGFDWQTMISTFEFTAFATAAAAWINYPTHWEPSVEAKVASFEACNFGKYRQVVSLWDYIVWAYISQHMGDAFNGAWQYTHMGETLEAYPRAATPESTANDGFGSMEAHVIGNYPDGSTSDLTMSISTDAEGKPVSASGSGTMVRADGTPMTVNSMTMTFSGGAPANGTMDITIGAPDNLHIVLTLTATGAATGTVYDTTTTPETQIGTIVIYAAPDAAGNNGYYEETATGTKYYF